MDNQLINYLTKYLGFAILSGVEIRASLHSLRHLTSLVYARSMMSAFFAKKTASKSLGIRA